jgi:hypothetical protein
MGTACPNPGCWHGLYVTSVLFRYVATIPRAVKLLVVLSLDTGPLDARFAINYKSIQP